MKILLVLVSAVGVAFATLFIVAATWVFSVYYDVKHSPKKTMFVCNQGHGPILEDHLIYFSGQPFCPLCFGKSMRQMKEIGERSILTKGGDK